MLLIFWHTLRDFPYSSEEEAVGQSLINMYYNFAKHNTAVYNDLPIERTKPNDVKCLEISSSAKITKLDEFFGNVKFWDDIEETLSSVQRTYYDGKRDEL